MLLTDLSNLSPWVIALIVVAIIWEAVWKLIGMWKAAKDSSVPWFIVLAIFNTVGILPILYIYVFSDRKASRKKRR